MRENGPMWTVQMLEGVVERQNVIGQKRKTERERDWLVFGEKREAAEKSGTDSEMLVVAMIQSYRGEECVSGEGDE